jgi:hypothetical protein
MYLIVFINKIFEIINVALFFHPISCIVFHPISCIVYRPISCIVYRPISCIVFSSHQLICIPSHHLQHLVITITPLISRILLVYYFTYVYSSSSLSSSFSNSFLRSSQDNSFSFFSSSVMDLISSTDSFILSSSA